MEVPIKLIEDTPAGDNSLDAFEKSKLNVMMTTVAEYPPEVQTLHDSASGERGGSMCFTADNIETYTGLPPRLGIEVLSEPSSGRGTPGTAGYGGDVIVEKVQQELCMAKITSLKDDDSSDGIRYRTGDLNPIYIDNAAINKPVKLVKVSPHNRSPTNLSKRKGTLPKKRKHSALVVAPEKRTKKDSEAASLVEVYSEKKPMISAVCLDHPRLTALLCFPPMYPVCHIPNLFGTEKKEMSTSMQEGSVCKQGLKSQESLNKTQPDCGKGIKVKSVGNNNISNSKARVVKGRVISDEHGTKNYTDEISGSSDHNRQEIQMSSDNTSHSLSQTKTADSNKVNNDLVEQYMKNWKQTGRYSCTDCPYSTVASHCLKRHWVSQHTKLTPYTCEECGFSTGLLSGLTTHQSSRHPDKQTSVKVDLQAEKELTEAFAKTFWHFEIDLEDSRMWLQKRLIGSSGNGNSIRKKTVNHSMTDKVCEVSQSKQSENKLQNNPAGSGEFLQGRKETRLNVQAEVIEDILTKTMRSKESHSKNNTRVILSTPTYPSASQAGLDVTYCSYNKGSSPVDTNAISPINNSNRTNTDNCRPSNEQMMDNVHDMRNKETVLQLSREIEVAMGSVPPHQDRLFELAAVCEARRQADKPQTS